MTIASHARPRPEFLNHSVVYQLFLRNFCAGGTLAEAEKLIPFLAELGVDILYLCPITLSDDDPRQEYWSPRQVASGMDNPQNPYRVKDFFRIDPEYGSDSDLNSFVATAHKYRLKVLLDLVYFHCGPGATIITEHPDFVRRDPDGKVKNGEWRFPELNFENPALREYLLGNMEYFVREFDIDGYRVDVGTARIPLDFFEAARVRLSALKEDIAVLGECENPGDQLIAFDFDYGLSHTDCLYRIFTKEESPEILQRNQERIERDFPENSLFMIYSDNHDYASDCYDNRLERRLGHAGKEAMLLTVFMLPGVPMLYNGEEIADDNRHSIYSNRFHGKNLGTRWENGFTEAGRRRLEFTRKLIQLRHSLAVLAGNGIDYLNMDGMIAFIRHAPGVPDLLVAVNPAAKPVRAQWDFKWSDADILLREGVTVSETTAEFAPYGYLVIEL